MPSVPWLACGQAVKLGNTDGGPSGLRHSRIGQQGVRLDFDEHIGIDEP